MEIASARLHGIDKSSNTYTSMIYFGATSRFLKEYP
jgi:hypothetical protein